MTYASIDIASSYKTIIVDLNRMHIPSNMNGAFDTVVNFGTSEHILNQMNTFKAVHDATKVGGLIMHSLPHVGYVDHGYFCYTSRFFFDLSGYNGYEVVDMWFDGPAGGENLFATARQYQSYFPSLTKRLDRIATDERESHQNALEIPVISINIVMRKTKRQPFMGTVETSTSVGALSSDVIESYRQVLSKAASRVSRWLR